jgi:hypothetical protein
MLKDSASVDRFSFGNVRLGRTEMNTVKQKLSLCENLAAIRYSPREGLKEVTGVAIVIPEGEIIELDRTAPLIGRMRLIEWNGFAYGVFPQDLQERADEPAPRLREKNAGIAAVHPG